MPLTKGAVAALAEAYKDDDEMLYEIADALETFENYHREIYSMETKLLITSPELLGVSAYQSLVSDLDGGRTATHNLVLTKVSLLNKLAANKKLPPLYEGTISKEKPYRREVANAVLGFINEVISQRR